ncbi:hypothetical protein NHF46_21460 [Arthrobacter alpinus]|nr:hypothetical protein [Arthrobacter alpinus]
MDLTIWLNFLIQTALIAAVSGLIFGGLAGYALASLGSIPVWVGVLVGALVPVIGLLVLAIVALSRHQKAQPIVGERWWIYSRAGRIFLITLGVLAGLLFFSMFLGWFKMRVAGIPALSVGAWGTAIGAVLVISLVVVVGAAALGARRPTRTGAVVIGWFGCWWLFLSVVALALQAPAVALADSVGALKYSVGDVTKLLNLKSVAGKCNCPTAWTRLGWAWKVPRLICPPWIWPSHPKCFLRCWPGMVAGACIWHWRRGLVFRHGGPRIGPNSRSGKDTQWCGRQHRSGAHCPLHCSWGVEPGWPANVRQPEESVGTLIGRPVRKKSHSNNSNPTTIVQQP